MADCNCREICVNFKEKDPDPPPPGPGPVKWALPGQVILDPDPKKPGRLAYNRDSEGDGQLDPCVVVCPGDPDWLVHMKPAEVRAMIQKQKVHGGNGHYLHLGMATTFDPKANLFKNPLQPGGALNTLKAALFMSYFGKMQRAGMSAVCAFLWDDNMLPEGWQYNKVVADEVAFVTNIARAFAQFPNLIPCLAEERAEAMGVERASELARIIKRAAPHRRLIGSHQNSGIDFDHAGDPLIKLFLIQYNNADRNSLHKAMIKSFIKSRGRYAYIMAESVDPNMSNTYGSGTIARKKDWACIMGGACGVMRYGFQYGIRDLKDMRIAQRFFESVRDFNELRPRDGLRHAGTEFVLAGPGTWILYSSRRVRYLGRKNASAGSYKLKWLDIKTGYIVKKTATTRAGKIGYKKPQSFGSEAALLVERI